MGSIRALSLVPLGGGLTFLLLMKAGLDGRATSGPDFGTEIIFSAAGLKTFVVYVQGRGLEGIGYSRWDKSDLTAPWRHLSNSSVEELAAFII